MELYQLKSFVILAEEGSLRPAAERLFISQPTLSGHIKALEDSFGFELFERTRRGMLLTDGGERFLKQAERILAETREANSLVAELRERVSGTLKIGLINDGLDLKTDATLAKLADTCPDINVEISNGNSGIVIKSLRDETLDLGYIESDWSAPGIDKAAIAWSHPVIIHPVHWTDCDDWSTLVERPWSFVSESCAYYRMIHAELEKRKLKMNWKYTVEHNNTAVSLVAQGLATAVVDRKLAEPAVSRGEGIIWPHFQPRELLSLAWLKRRANEKPILAYRDAVMRTFKLKLSA